MNEQEIYIEAMARQDPADRQRYLDQACGEDVPLRQRLDALINHTDKVGDFLQQPAVVFSGPSIPSPPLVGEQIGPYKLREQIGEGGMGVVYVAEQTEPVIRKVALKIIRSGSPPRTSWPASRQNVKRWP